MRIHRRAAHLALNVFMPLVAAVQFLTRLPIPITCANADAVFRRSAVFFPAAGLLIGVLTAGAASVLSGLLPLQVNAALLLGLWVMLTGGLHLDGLMDTADGLISHRSRERMLEIMKDSRVGAMGVIACVLALLLKASLLYSLLAGSLVAADTGVQPALAWPQRLALLALVPVWSRAFLPVAISFWPYARTEGSGLGSLFQAVRVRHAAAAFALASAITFACLRLLGGFDGTASLVMCACFAGVSCVIGGVLGAAISRKLGGLTGDVYGALNEMIELALLLGLVAYGFHAGP